MKKRHVISKNLNNCTNKLNSSNIKIIQKIKNFILDSEQKIEFSDLTNDVWSYLLCICTRFQVENVLESSRS